MGKHLRVHGECAFCSGRAEGWGHTFVEDAESCRFVKEESLERNFNVWSTWLRLKLNFNIKSKGYKIGFCSES